MSSGGILGLPEPGNHASGEGYSFANRFTTTTTQQCQGFRWHRYGSSPFPTKLYVYDRTAGVEKVGFSTTGMSWTSLTNNWYELTLATAGQTAFNFISGHDYTVAYYSGGASSIQEYDHGQSPATGYTWQDGRYAAGDSNNPGTYSDFFYAIDLITDTVGGTTGGGGGSDPATTGDLASWLSSDATVQTHETDGLPWLTKAVVDSILTAANAIKATTDLLGNASAGAIEKLNRWSDAAIDALNKASDLANDWPNLLNDRIFGSDAGGGSAFTSLHGALDSIASSTGAGNGLIREWITLSPDLADTTRWELVATTLGEGALLVEDQADMYRLTILGTGGDPHAEDMAGVLWYPRWGWVAPRVHGFYGQRQFHDLAACCITANGLFMDGLLVGARPGVTWSVDAYVLDRS